MKTVVISLKNVGKQSLIIFALLALAEISLLFGDSVNSIFALITEPPAQEVVEAGLFDFEVDYMGEVHNRKDINGNITCNIGDETFDLDGYDYFIVKMAKGGFDFVKFGPQTGNDATYWTDYTINKPADCSSHSDWGFVTGQPSKHMAVDVIGTTKANAKIRLRPNSTWGQSGTLQGWRVWRVKVNSEGFPGITTPNFIKHADEDVAYPNDGTLTAGCTVSYLMMDDDPAVAGDTRQQTWHVQKKNPDNTWSDIQPVIPAPDSGMVVGKSFPVAEIGGNPELRLFLEVEDSINMLHLEQCGSTYTYQIEMTGVFIATGQREREGVGESGFKFERDIFVPAGVAPLLISYDPKYLFEFADLLGGSLIDWVEVPN